MSAKVFDGREFSRIKKEKVRSQVDSLVKRGIKPTLASVFLPTDRGSSLYTKVKRQAALAAGMGFVSREIGDSKDKSGIISQVEELNADAGIHGILVQKPSGKNDFLDEDWEEIVAAIKPEKDVDGLRPDSHFLPATVKAILYILDEARVKVRGAKIAVVGSRGMVGKPLVSTLKKRGAKVVAVYREKIGSLTREADVVISATGASGIIGAGMIKRGAVVVDAGEPKGDIRTEEILKKARFISPVPGGVGPVTVACLLENTVQAAEEY